MSYVYRGNQFDAPETAEPPHPSCGTRAGYRRHQNHDELPCDPCRAAHCQYMIEYKKAKVAA